MSSRLKIHLLAITAICITVIIAFQFKPKPVQQIEKPVVLSGKFVIIHSASWGLNCLDSAKQALAEATDDEVKPGAKLPQIPRNNNALITISDLCNEKESCVFTPTKQLLGEFAGNCFAKLELAYRCFEFDKIHYLNGEQEQEITIDCQTK
jgi:hypothetical protein